MFKDVLDIKVHEHFLCFSTAMFILLNEGDDFCNHYKEYEKQLLEYFVKNSEMLYGKTFAVCNVYGLLCISDDMGFWCLQNNISVFSIGNYFQILKKYIKNAQKLVGQVSKQVNEISLSGSIFHKETLEQILYMQKNNCFLLDEINIVFVIRKTDEEKN